MLGAAPTQAVPRVRTAACGLTALLAAAAIAICAAPSALAAHRQLHSSPRLWAVQLHPGAPHWLDARSVRVLRAQGVNALVLDVQRLGRAPRAARMVDTARRFSVRQSLLLVAVVPSSQRHVTRAVRHTLTACARHARGVRCATRVGGLGPALALAKRHRYVAVSIAGPSGFATFRSLPSLSRHVLVIAKLYNRFDPWVWSGFLAEAATAKSTDLAVSPQTSLSSQPVQEFGATLASTRNLPTGLTAPGNLATSNVTRRSLTLSWTEAAASAVGYRLYRGGKRIATVSTKSFSYGGLSCGTKYSLGVSAYDARGHSSAITKTTGQTAPCTDTTAPSMPVRLTTSNVGQTSITLSWQGSTDDVNVAGYRLYVDGVQVGTATGTTFTFTGLACWTTAGWGLYSLGVSAYDAAGNLSAVSTTAQQTQQCSATGQPPSTPTGLATSNVGTTAMTLSWSPSTSTAGLAGYQLSLNGAQVGTTAITSYDFIGLTCGTSYTLGVTAVDIAGTVSGTTTMTRQTLACATDAAAPSTPTNLHTTSAGQTSIAVAWNASTDNVGVTGYRLYVDGVQVGSTGNTSYMFTGLACWTTPGWGVYTLGVAAFDAAGNISPIASLDAQTQQCPGDTTPPSTPTGLATSNLAQTSVSLSWTASTDNVGVTGYRLFVNGTQVGTATGTSYSFGGLTCATTYTLGVAAYDAAVNVSGTATKSVTTAACTGGGGPGTHVCAGRSFYVDYAAGNDANTGTSQAASWKRAPGMRGFAGSYSRQAHDCFYFKGGTTWPNAVFPLTPTGGGDASANMYYGPDTGWYAGSSWSRPVFDAGNAEINGGNPDTFFDLDGADYSTVDNIEFTGFKAVGQGYGTCAMISLVGPTHVVIDNIYVHNFSIDGPSDTNCMAVQAATYGSYGGSSVVRNSVFAGDGTSYGEAIRCVSNVKNTVIHDMVGMIFPCGQGEVSGNSLYNCGYPSFPAGASGVHGDAIQPTMGNGPLYIHDNVIHDTGSDSSGNECEAMLVGNANETDYVWNNVIYNVHGNSVALIQDGSAGVGAYIWNNTITGGQNGTAYCVRQGHSGTWPTVVIRNNHCITTAGRTDDPSIGATTKTVDHNVTQTPAQATAQGYTPTATYAYSPTSASVATIATGADLAASCSGANAGLCASTTYGAQPSGLAPHARASGSAWDVGAYQRLGSGSSFYVDPTASGANNGTSWANAWTSFASVTWSSIHAGDTLYVSGGSTSQTYTAPSFTVGASGTASQPLTIRPGADPGHDGTVVFDYASLGGSATATGISLGSRSNVTITGDVGSVSHWQLKNLYNTSSGTSSDGIAGSGGNTGIKVDRMTFVNDNNPVRFTSTTGITISNNSFQQVRGDAAIAMAGSSGGFDSSRIFGNYIERECTPNGGVPTSLCPGPDGVQVGSGVSIYSNQFKQITTGVTTSTQHPDGIQAQGDNLKIYGNTFTNVGDSDIDFDTFADGTPHDVYVYNNVFRITDPIDLYPEYFRLYRSSGVALQSITNFKLVNNDFVDNDYSYRAVRFDTFGGNPTGSGNQIANNIFYNSGNGSASGSVVYIDPSSGFTGSSWALDYNSYYRSAGAPYVSFGGTSYTAASWVAGHEPHGRVAAPAFTSYAYQSPGNDFHLTATDTVAKDTGTALSSLFTTDLDGLSRPQGGAWDLGAYEQH